MMAPGPSAARAPRVLMVIGQLDVGGAERHVVQVASALRTRGLEIAVFVLKPGGALAPLLAAAGVPVLARDGRRPGLRGLWQASRHLAALVRRERFDVVHFFLPAAYLVGAVATLGAPVRRVMSRRSLAHYQARYPGVRQVERWLHRRMDAVLGNSRAVARELMREGVPPDRLGVIYNGVVDRTAGHVRAAARGALGLAADALVFVMIANLIPYKGHADLLHAMSLARGDLPPDWCLVCAGRDDGIKADLLALARRLDIETHLRWLGPVEDVGVCLAAADIGVLCSHEEGFSNAVLEGMAAGLPMVVTDVGGNAEAVIDGHCGRVVPAHDPVALAAALTSLARDPDQRRALGDEARERARQCFTVGACVAQYQQLYRNLADGIVPPLTPAVVD